MLRVNFLLANKFGGINKKKRTVVRERKKYIMIKSLKKVVVIWENLLLIKTNYFV